MRYSSELLVRFWGGGAVLLSSGSSHGNDVEVCEWTGEMISHDGGSSLADGCITGDAFSSWTAGVDNDEFSMDELADVRPPVGLPVVTSARPRTCSNWAVLRKSLN